MTRTDQSRSFHEGFSVMVPGSSSAVYEYPITRGIFRIDRLYLEPLLDALVRIGDGRDFSTWYPVSYFSGAGVDGPSLGQPLRKHLEMGQRLFIEFHERRGVTVEARGVFYGKEIW